jgi:hypothetical protein
MRKSKTMGTEIGLILCLGVLILSGCRPKVDDRPSGPVQTGIASWYGEDFHGRRTSSREIYDMNDLTAAHNTLPFGTMAVVTNLNNGRSVVVRINDRGPFVKSRNGSGPGGSSERYVPSSVRYPILYTSRIFRSPRECRQVAS